MVCFRGKLTWIRKKKIALAKKNIKNAIRDYGLHTNSTGVFDDISDDFIERVDNYAAKASLREMFRKSPAWDEKLDALFISLNPAHFITMSNPIDDKRGETITNCHSFNRTDYPFNNSCTGYACDSVTIITFTASNAPEKLNNRKITRQLYIYQPENGLLLQSRMYNTSGGTRGAQAESKVYRDLIQREISACEKVPNLWKTFKYCGNNKNLYFDSGFGFGGYADWVHSDFNAMVSIREMLEIAFIFTFIQCMVKLLLAARKLK